MKTAAEFNSQVIFAAIVILIVGGFAGWSMRGKLAGAQWNAAMNACVTFDGAKLPRCPTPPPGFEATQ